MTSLCLLPRFCLAHLYWFCLLPGLGMSHLVSAQTLIKLCYEDATYFPWQIKNGHGLDNNLVEMAAQKIGVKVEMLAIPWKRCMTEVGYDTQAGGFAASYNLERASFAVYPMRDGKPDPGRRMRYDSYSLYRLKGSSASWDGKQLSQLSGPVGVQLGYSIAVDLRKLGADVDESHINPELQLRKLLAGRVQLVALLTLDGDKLLEQPGFAQKVERINPALVERPYFLIFNKEYYARNSKLVNDMWDALAQVRESEQFKTLRQKRIKAGQ
ncbi:MAG: hypothetical protein RL748_4053 [Pseudomonadota bacterium]